MQTEQTIKNQVNIVTVKSKTDFNCLLDYLRLIYPNQDESSLRFNASMARFDLTYLLKSSNTIIGSVWLIELSIPNFYVGGIGGVTILSEYRKKGLGKMIVEYVIHSNPDFDAFLLWTRVPEFFSTIGFRSFEAGIQREINDSTPMLYSNNQNLSDGYPVPKWPRIKF